MAILSTAALIAFTPSLFGPITVVDADTVDRGAFRYRLVGFDAPEIRNAQCPEERALGQTAAQRLGEMISNGRAELHLTQTRKDRWGRLVARLTVDGQDVGPLLIAEGLARAYDGRSKRLTWC